PHVVSRGLAAAHRFEDSCVKTTPEAEAYWRDVGTIDAYWAANLDLVMPTPSLDIYDPNWPIWTYQQQLPPAKFVFDDDDRRGMAVDSMVSAACIISASTVRRSLLFSNCRVTSYVQTCEAVLLPDVQVGRHARLNKVVVDRGCRIKEGLVIGEDPELDAKRFYCSDGGVTLVSADMLAALDCLRAADWRHQKPRAAADRSLTQTWASRPDCDASRAASTASSSACSLSR